METENRLTAVRGERDQGLSEKSEGIKQKKKILIKTNNSIVITREKEGWEEAEECKWGINGDRRKFELGWSTHNTIYR